MITVHGMSMSGNCHKVRQLLEHQGRERGWTPPGSPRRAELPRLRERGHQALAVMDRHLAAQAWFTGDRYGIADIALFAYTSVAHHGGFDLAPYPAIGDWLGRVRATPGYMPMPDLDAEATARLAQPD